MNRFISFLLFIFLTFFNPSKAEDVFFQRKGESIKSPKPEKNPPLQIKAKLFFPSTKLKKYSSVVVIHGTAGIGYREKKIRELLLEKNISVLEIDLFGSRNQAPSSSNRMISYNYLPDVYGAFYYLSRHPKIDKDKIGLTGFSLGGAITFQVALGNHPWDVSTDWPSIYPKAAVAWYPVCSSFMKHKKINKKVQKEFSIIKNQLNKSNFIIIAPSGDNYENSPKTACKKASKFFFNSEENVWLVKGATHGFDGNSTATFQDIGRTIRVHPNGRLGSEYRKRVVEFFLNKFE